MKKLIIGVGAGVLTLFYLLSFLNEEAPPPEPEARPMEFARSSLKMSRPAERNSSPKSVDPSEPSQPSPKTRKPRNRRQEARQKPDQKKKPLKKKASKDPPRPGYFQITEVNGYATFLGDILIEDVDEFIGKMDRGERLIHGIKRWPRGVVPFQVDHNERGSQIYQAIDTMNESTKIKFVEQTDEENYVVFREGKGCYSFVGMKGGPQPIILDEHCSVGSILHEMMHVLGFYHEQSRPDRDEHLEVLWGNIQDQYKTQYLKLPPFVFPTMEIPFDFQSIMLYGSYNKFGVERGKPTMVNLEGEGFRANRENLSPGDLNKIRRLYLDQL